MVDHFQDASHRTVCQLKPSHCTLVYSWLIFDANCLLKVSVLPWYASSLSFSLWVLTPWSAVLSSVGPTRMLLWMQPPWPPEIRIVFVNVHHARHTTGLWWGEGNTRLGWMTDSKDSVANSNLLAVLKPWMTIVSGKVIWVTLQTIPVLMGALLMKDSFA